MVCYFCGSVYFPANYVREVGSVYSFLIVHPSVCPSIYPFSSPEPKAHRWAYSIARHPSSVRQRFQMTSPLKPWSRSLQNFTYSIYRQWERIMAFFVGTWIFRYFPVCYLYLSATYTFATYTNLFWSSGLSSPTHLVALPRPLAGGQGHNIAGVNNWLNLCL